MPIDHQLLLHAIGLKATTVCQETGMDPKTIRAVLRGRNVTVRTRDMVIDIIAKKYHAMRSSLPESLDKYVWESLFPYAPYPANNTTPKAPRQTKPKIAAVNPNETESPCSSPTSFLAAQAHVTRHAGPPCVPEKQSANLTSIDGEINTTSHTSIEGTTPVNLTPRSLPNSCAEVLGQGAILHAPTAEAGHLGGQPEHFLDGCDFAALESVRRFYPSVSTRAQTQEFYRRCLAAAWGERFLATKKPLQGLAHFLRRLCNTKKRARATDPAVAKRRSDIFAIIGPPYAAKRKEGHAKGADDNHSFSNAKSCLKGVLATPAIQSALMAELGEIPSEDYCEGVLREKLGGVNPYAEVKDHLQRTIGFRPLYDGHVLLIDATGIPVKVRNAWGEKSVGQKGNRNGFQKRWAYLCVDVASAHTWIGTSFSDNEGTGWPIFMDWLLFDALQYAPEHVSCDQMSEIFSGLKYIAPGELIKLHKAALKFLAAGVKPYIHQPKRPTGGAHAEVAVKGFKSTLNEISVRKALEKEFAGQGWKKAREYDSEAEFVAMMNETRAAVNQKHLGRAGDIRANLWADPESVAKRQERALVHNAREISDDIIARVKVATVSGNLCVANVRGEHIMAELDTPLDFAPKETTALVLPCGLRVGDDPERVRVLLVQDRAGQPLYHMAEAKVSKKDKRGFDMLQPVFGTGFRAQPDTKIDELTRIRTATSELHRAKIASLKQGTTNEEIEERHYE